MIHGSNILMEMEISHIFIAKRGIITKWYQYCCIFFHRPLDGKLSTNSTLPMVIRLGHYYFDNKPLIGKIVDFHVWSRYNSVYIWTNVIFHLGIFNRILSEDELALYSDCSKHADKSGDLINSSSAVKVKYYKYWFNY